MWFQSKNVVTKKGGGYYNKIEHFERFLVIDKLFGWGENSHQNFLFHPANNTNKS